VDDRKHMQLSSRFILQRLVNIIKNCPLIKVATLIKVVMIAWGYSVKYDRAWRVKQCALKLIYVDWANAYERLPAMKAKNPGLYFQYIPKPDPKGRQYFFCAF
jgi:hypothetical protein